MNEFESVLQECLRGVEQGTLSVDECLSRHPTYAGQLEPILLTSAYLARGRAARLSPAFKARVRTRLVQQLVAHPRRVPRTGFLFMRWSASLAALILALFITGTVYAQRALPGEAFYGWKLASENAWRVVSPNPVETDLVIAERRLDELIKVRHDAALYAQALEAYLEVEARLKSELNASNEARILETLDSQAEELDRLGILPKESDPDIVPTPEGSILTPVGTPLPVVATPLVEPTELPQIVPTVEVLPETLPTVPDPPRILPTIEIPPPIP